MLELQRAHRLTGFSSMDTAPQQRVHVKLQGAPPDGFLIDGHQIRAVEQHMRVGAPPDGFLIDGHVLIVVVLLSDKGRTA